MVELIVTMVVLAILAVVGIFGALAYTSYSESRECEESRSIAASAANVELKLDPGLAAKVKKGADVFDYIKDGSQLKNETCPCGGKYTAVLKTDADGKYYFEIECSYHID